MEGGILPPGKGAGVRAALGIFRRTWSCVRFFPPGWEARLYGRQGCLPLQANSEGLLPSAGLFISAESPKGINA